MKQTEFAPLEPQFKDLLKDISIFNTETELDRKNRLRSDFYPFRSLEISLQTKYCRKVEAKSTLMTNCNSMSYLVCAFCLIEGQCLSTITLQIINKRDQRRQQKRLRSIYVRVTAMKMAFDVDSELQLYLGTKCGKLLIYRNFEREEIKVSSVKISSHPISHLLVSQTMSNILFALTENGTIYLINTKK